MGGTRWINETRVLIGRVASTLSAAEEPQVSDNDGLAQFGYHDLYEGLQVWVEDMSFEDMQNGLNGLYQ